MFDVGYGEFLLVAFVALVVIGPKDLPKAMRVVGYWVGRARGVARQFRSGFDSMVREAELEEMEKRWAKENERIMREHSADTPPTDGVAAAEPYRPVTFDGTGAAVADPGSIPDQASEPVHVERPHVEPAPGPAQAPRGDGVTS